MANPAPLYGTKKFPNGSSHPGPNLYTNSIVALNGQTGKLIWFRQAVPHDVRDYDLRSQRSSPPSINGVETEIVLVASKRGKVFAFRAADGRLWKRSVGRHLNDTGPLPRKPISIFPGDLGGVETPMALADGPSLRAVGRSAIAASATGRARVGGINFHRAAGASPRSTPRAEGDLAAKLPSMDFGAATVANDVVFTSDYAGKIYAFDIPTGKTLWTGRPRRDQLVPGHRRRHAARRRRSPGFFKKPQFQLVAYSLANDPSTAPRPSPAQASTARTAASTRPGHRQEFLFRLSTKSITKPRKVTFDFRNVETCCTTSGSTASRRG